MIGVKILIRNKDFSVYLNKLIKRSSLIIKFLFNKVIVFNVKQFDSEIKIKPFWTLFILLKQHKKIERAARLNSLVA